METSDEFSREVESARKVLRGVAKPLCADQEFRTSDWLHLTVEKSFNFLSVSEYEQTFQMHPKDAGVELMEIQDENGRLESGVILKDESAPGKKLKLSWGYSTCLNTSLLNSAAVLRSQQPAEYQGWYNGDMLRSRPAPLQPKAPTPLTLDEMRARVQEAKERKAQAAEQRQASGPDRGPQPPEIAQPAAQEEEGTESDAEFDPASVLPSEKARRDKVKGKGNKRKPSGGGRGDTTTTAGSQGSARRRVNTKAPPSATATVAGVQAPERRTVAASSDRSRSPLPGGRSGPSVGTRASTSMQSTSSPTERLRGQAVKYLTDVQLDKMVLGYKLGLETSIARRVAAACEARPGELASEAVELKGHLELGNIALELSVNKMNKVPAKQRKEMLQRLWPRMECHPASWCANIFLLHVREMTLETPEDMEKWIRCVSPVLEGVSSM